MSEWLIKHLSQIITGVIFFTSVIFAYTDLQQAQAVQAVRIQNLEIVIATLKVDILRSLDSLTYEVRELRKDK